MKYVELNTNSSAIKNFFSGIVVDFFYIIPSISHSQTKSNGMSINNEMTSREIKE